MPIYEYRCQECERQTEALQKVADPPLTECPHCGGPLTKLISAPAFQFKGSGWYVTDYARKSGASGGSGSAGEGGGDGGGKGDAAGKEAASTSSSSGDSAAKGKSKSTSSGGSSGDA